MQIIDSNAFQFGDVETGNEVPSMVPHGDLTDAECLYFGDFSDNDYDKFFALEKIRSTSVQFICDTYNDTETWVEEGQKHLLDLEPIEDELSFNSEHVETENGKVDEKSEEVAAANGNNVINGGIIIGETEDLMNGVTEGVDLLNISGKEDVAGVSFTDNDDDKPEIKIEPAEEKTESVIATPEKIIPEEKVENGTAYSNEKIESESKVDDSSQKKSWASLFKSSEAAVESPPNGVKSVRTVKVETPIISNEIVEKETVTENGLSMISMDQDERASKLAEFISHWYPDYSRTHVQLHGLINRANWCYINATLQALLAIPVIYHFYKNLSEFLNEDTKSTSTPLTDSMIAFFNRFHPIEVQGKKENEELHYGHAFEPKGVYDVLSVMKSSLSEKGRQEDAEEFLSFLLNGVHDELVALSKLVQPKTKEIVENGDVNNDSNNEDEDAWEEVGPKNKARTIRKAVIQESLMKHVFGGVICSSVLQTGAKESTTFQPFFTLQLDIQSEDIQTLNNAIEFYFMKEKLQGFTCSKTKTEVEASRRISLEELPLMFIFHLKYFVFDRKGGSQKLHKEIEIPVDLEIPRDILSNNKNPNTTRRYKLHAVVYHHGKHAAGGHYTASVHHGNPFGWIHFDDNHVKSVNMTDMVKHQQGSVPYLLFYERIQHR